MACGNVLSRVKYLQKLPLYDDEKPFQLFIPIEKDAPDQRTSNLEFEYREREFQDVRENIGDFGLDTHGFEMQRRPTALDLEAFQNRAVVEDEYFAEIKEILKSVDGGYDSIRIFDWRLRNSETAMFGTEYDMNDPMTWLRPSPNVHVGDQSDRAVVHRIQLHLPDEAANLLMGRVRVVNVWRPIDHAVEDYPLAFCDPSTMPDEDLVECDHVRRKFKGSTLYAHFNEAHKWYYLGRHQPDEVLLLKMFDSDPSVAAKRLAHAAFLHPSATETSRPRQSIEVRALLFNHPEEVAT